jgi:BioD-like phosphotransacetylase family protein
MNTFVMASLRPNAGKTTLIIGMAKALNRTIGYIKPFGERFLYRKKRLWDYDAALVTHIFDLKEHPEEMSIGFHHSKLLYMLDERGTEEKLKELLESVGEGKELFFAECGKDITFGASVHLDAISVARQLDAPLIFVVSGREDAILDDLLFLKKYIQPQGVRIKGIIINKVANIEDFCETKLPQIKMHGIEVLGVIPFCKELPCFSLAFMADRLFAKVIAAEGSLNRVIKNIIIGDMSSTFAQNNPLFQTESRIVITSGDRCDMIVAALECNSAAVIITNNIAPPPAIIEQASRMGIPLLLVSADTYEIAHQIENMESLLTRNDVEKLTLIEQMVRRHVNFETLLQS